MVCAPGEMNRYVEPFVGSGCLFFALRPKVAVLGDINGELLRVYSTIRDHPRQVYRVASAMPRTAAQYYRLRDKVQISDDAIAEAARFVYLNRYCFNGVYRTNRSGGFNVPRGRKTGDFPAEKVFYRCSVALRNAEFRTGDFTGCIEDVGPGDFVYLDPPYAMSSHRDRGEYGRGSFQKNDIGRLLDCLPKIDSAGATFVLSYANCPEIRVAASHWFSAVIKVRRHVAGFGRHRRVVSEVLISNKELICPLGPKVCATRCEH